MLLDFCYYFVLRIFDENSDERFKRENRKVPACAAVQRNLLANHRYFKAYTRISDANTCILKSVLVSFQFKDDFMTVVRRHSQILWLQREELRSAGEKCEVGPRFGLHPCPLFRCVLRKHGELCNCKETATIRKRTSTYPRSNSHLRNRYEPL